MTYCCGILVRDGLVMFADTRTNAGVDNIATFRKLHVMTLPGERIMAIASAGNLSISQSVVSIVREGWENPETGETETVMNARTMFQAAQRVGSIVRELHQIEGEALEASDVKFDVSFLLGGQIKGERPRLFLLYAAGNFIECTRDTPYLQIGEHKYGKPVLDRAITYDIDLYDALKVGLVSVDSTMRSNLSVGLPIDLLIARRDACDAELNYRIGGAARRACRNSAPALQERPLNVLSSRRTPRWLRCKRSLSSPAPAPGSARRWRWR
jgi:putative proteasome-type protease